MGRAELERVAALFATDAELVATMVHEKKREAVAGLSRPEILDLMESDYTYLNRPIAVRGRTVACGPLRFNLARYDERFGA